MPKEEAKESTFDADFEEYQAFLRWREKMKNKLDEEM